MPMHVHGKNKSRDQFLVGGSSCKMLPYVEIWCNILACMVYMHG